nr:hypothetical protein Q903MT_gene6487 [Picea sitchensis]
MHDVFPPDQSEGPHTKEKCSCIGGQAYPSVQYIPYRRFHTDVQFSVQSIYIQSIPQFIPNSVCEVTDYPYNC